MFARNLENKAYRLTMNVLARTMRSLMRAREANGHFCIGSDSSYFETRDGIKFGYSFSDFGTAGNIDSGGNTESETVEKLLSLLQDRHVFYDIGAHEGLFTLSVKKRKPAVQVYAFEPLASGLKTNLALNRLEVPVFEYALGDEPGAAKMTTEFRSSNHVAINGSGTSVSVERLDALVEKNNLPSPNFVKQDVEGFELFVLRGAGRLLDAKPVLITEINECLAMFGLSAFDLYEFLSSSGYVPYRLLRGQFLAMSASQFREDPLLESADYNYWWMPA